ncbi:MAG: alpha/beta hydrolase [Saprospiraceae bacterium]|nr:MAG: alpha/beta hydrolase [Saprospiraceae bacterium]
MIKLKKRYLALALLIALFAVTHMEFLTFRKSEEMQRAYLLKREQTGVTFATIEVAGQKLHYTHVGSDTLPLVVMVHGAPGSSSGMLDYLANERLTGVAQVVAVDRPGYGFSGFGKAERSLEKQAAIIEPIMEKYRASQAACNSSHPPLAILAGHSFGGPVIARAAMDYPELVDGLVIVAGSMDPGLEPRDWWQAPLDWPVMRSILPPAARVCNQEILPLPGELEKMLPLWEKITCPVTVIQGLKDKLVHPGNAAFARKMLVNSSRLEIDTLENDGHFILWTKKGRVAEKIIEMVDRLKR